MTNFALGTATANLIVQPKVFALGVTGPNTGAFEPDFKKWQWPVELTGELDEQPTAVMEPASSVTSSSAIINALVDPRGLDTTVIFDYGSATDGSGNPIYGLTTSPITLVAVIGSQIAAVPLSGLTADTNYFARCRATNANGTTISTFSSFHTLGDGGGLPQSGPPISNVDLQPIGAPTQTSVSLTCAFDMNNAAGLIHIERLVGATWTDIVTPLATDGAINTMTGVATGLTAGTSYQFRSRATNPYNPEPAGVINGPITVVTAPPDPTLPVPSLVSTSNIATTSADVTGRISSYVESTDSWFFEYGTTTAYGSQTATVTDTSIPVSGTEDVTATLTPLVPSTTYHYRLVIQRTDGKSGLIRSADGQVTTAAIPGIAVPVVVTNAATNITQTTATINGTITVNF